MCDRLIREKEERLKDSSHFCLIIEIYSRKINGGSFDRLSYFEDSWRHGEVNNFVSPSPNFYAPVISSRGRISVIYRFFIYLLATRNPIQPGLTNQPFLFHSIQSLPLLLKVVPNKSVQGCNYKDVRKFNEQEFNILKDINVISRIYTYSIQINILFILCPHNWIMERT